MSARLPKRVDMSVHTRAAKAMLVARHGAIGGAAVADIGALAMMVGPRGLRLRRRWHPPPARRAGWWPVRATTIAKIGIGKMSWWPLSQGRHH